MKIPTQRDSTHANLKYFPLKSFWEFTHYTNLFSIRQDRVTAAFDCSLYPARVLEQPTSGRTQCWSHSFRYRYETFYSEARSTDREVHFA